MEFQEFNKIPRLSRDCTITEKIHGCFDYKSRVLTDHGYEPIGKIVNQKLNRQILTYNFDKKQFEYSKILNYFKQSSKYNDFLSIKLKGYKRGTAYYRFRCTHNHLILTKKGYKRADQLTLNDKILSPNNPLSYIQKQMILGTLLGDATVRIPNKISLGYSHAQSIKHKEYSEIIKNILGRFYQSFRILKGGYAKTDIIHIESNFDYQLQNYLKNFLINQKKFFTEQCLAELTPISLAFWYMDDGSVNFNDNQQQPRVVLCTHGFSKPQVKLLLDVLRKKFNFNPSFVNYGKGWQIVLDTTDSQKLFYLVSPYIPKIMKYKLPKTLRKTKCFWDTYNDDKSKFYEQTILEIKENNNTGNEYHYKYDLETANHNYIVSGVVVHNSNGQVFIVHEQTMREYWANEKNDNKVHDFAEKYSLYSDGYLFIFAGSRKRWLNTSKNGDNMGFAKWVKDNAEELLKLGEGRCYGEWWGKNIQNGYGIDEKRFSLFNARKWCEHDQEPKLISVNPKTKEEKYQTKAPKCCNVVPILYEGLFDTRMIQSVLYELSVSGSVASPGYKNPEGIVIYHSASGKLFKKTILNDEKPKGI